MGATGLNPGPQAGLKWAPGPADATDVAVVIKADCPDCGVVRLRTGDLTVRVNTDDGSGAYCFRCASCGTAVSHEANESVRDLLGLAGVRVEEWHWPAELEERPVGPALTTDDLLDFHLALRDDAWPDRLAEVAEG